MRNLSLVVIACAALSAAAQAQVTFNMVVSAGAATCLPYATATVTITPAGTVDIMDVSVSGLPPNTTFDFFVIQLPKAPFGISWYQGDIETDDYGQGNGEFVGIFSIETFTVAPGVGPAPVVFTSPISDASSNPQTAPVHSYHLGLWFDSPDDAAANGCPNALTPFNGPHNAGIQVLNTSNFPDLQGPLYQVASAPSRPLRLRPARATR